MSSTLLGKREANNNDMANLAEVLSELKLLHALPTLNPKPMTWRTGVEENLRLLGRREGAEGQQSFFDFVQDMLP